MPLHLRTEQDVHAKSRLNCISPLSFQREIAMMTFLRPWRPSLDVLHRKSHLIWGWFNFRKYLVLWPLDVSCDTIYLQGPLVTIFLAAPLQQSRAAPLLERGASGGSDYSRTTAENYVQVVIYETSLGMREWSYLYTKSRPDVSDLSAGYVGGGFRSFGTHMRPSLWWSLNELYEQCDRNDQFKVWGIGNDSPYFWTHCITSFTAAAAQSQATRLLVFVNPLISPSPCSLLPESFIFSFVPCLFLTKPSSVTGIIRGNNKAGAVNWSGFKICKLQMVFFMLSLFYESNWSTPLEMTLMSSSPNLRTFL